MYLIRVKFVEIRKLMGSQIIIFRIAKVNMKVYMENKLIFYRLQQ